MFIHCELVILTLALTLNGRVHTVEIFGGHEAVPHSRPYMVLLEEHAEGGQTKYCDGFLLNEDFVMTAAHCKARSYTVLLGVHDIFKTNEIQRVSVEQAFPHKEFNSTSLKNDIMLLKMSSKVKFTENVQPIAIADRSDGSLPKSCMVIGWGRANRNKKENSPILMEANVTLIDHEGCADENFYCSEGETGPGEGDSGGPLVCEDGKAFGVVSFSIKPTSGGQIYAYAKISDHKSWISLTMKNA